MFKFLYVKETKIDENLFIVNFKKKLFVVVVAIDFFNNIFLNESILIFNMLVSKFIKVLNKINCILVYRLHSFYFLFL